MVSRGEPFQAKGGALNGTLALRRNPLLATHSFTARPNSYFRWDDRPLRAKMAIGLVTSHLARMVLRPWLKGTTTS
jgi:hypothetical protein